MTIQRPLKIGAVVDVLSEEFPDISVSKVRFLEGEGLIDPPRTDSGYRQFHAADVERIRYILRQQRDHFLPLKVIKDNLDKWERGQEPTTAQPDGPPPETYFAVPAVEYDAQSLAQTAGVAVRLIEDLARHGVLIPKVATNGLETFDGDDLAVVRAAQRLVGHGLEARHLRQFRLGANREVDLFRQLTGPLLRHASPSSLDQAAEVLADVAQAARDLQETLVRSQLRSTLGR
jgi:DNA-binding transcriptional MerR regulator